MFIFLQSTAGGVTGPHSRHVLIRAVIHTDTDTEYLFNVVYVKHGTNISSVELLLRQTMVYQQNHR